MKRTVLFGAMVLLLVLTFVTGFTKPAYAWQQCSEIDGDPCEPGSAPIPCTTEDQLESDCTCFHAFTYWACRL
jgi:hypothetical protein